MFRRPLRSVVQGFMAAMEMSYAVTPPSLLNRLNAGDKIRFTLVPWIGDS